MREVEYDPNQMGMVEIINAIEDVFFLSKTNKKWATR
jgi:hypothetical protein